MRVLAVGDIHTKLWILEAVEKLVDNYDKVVFVGDYADDWGKGPAHTLAVWTRLKEFQDNHIDKVAMVIGNHDYIYVNYTKTTSGGYSRMTQTLIDMPENRSLRDWLRELPVTLELDGVTYSHAGITESWNGKLDSNTLWEDDSPIWARPTDYPYPTEYKPFPQVFGHTPSPTCWEVMPNVWCIDTFSTYQDGTPIGDHTVLEVIDGEKFNKVKLEK